jgi:hypothetical protein
MRASSKKVDMLEAKTRGQVDDLIEESFPSASSHTSWIERDEPRRHVSVRFVGLGAVEGAGATWTEAIADIRRQLA